MEFKRARILVIEDEPEASSSIERLLKKKLKAVVEIAGDGREAISKFNNQRFDLVTLDYQLPDMNGLELLEQIMRAPSPPPVIMVTGHGAEEVAAAALQIGAIGYVLKDVKLARSLTRVVEKTLTEIQLRTMEEALDRSEREYQRLVETANSIILKMDRQGNLTYINTFGEQFFGYSSEELIGKNVQGTIVPFRDEAGVDMTEGVNRILADPDSFVVNENENIKRNGERVWMAWSNHALRDEHGQVIGNVAIGNDITERKNAEGELRNFSYLADNLPEPVTMIGLDGRIIYHNRAYAELLGCEPGEAESLKVADTLSPASEVSEMMEDARSAGPQEEQHRELEVLRKDGTRARVKISTSLLRDEADQAVGLVVLYAPPPGSCRPSQ